MSNEVLSTPKQCLKLIMDVLRKSCPPYDEISLLGKALRTLDNLVQKDEKYAWHDLRKNPQDLPKIGKEVYTFSEVYVQYSPDPDDYGSEYDYCIDVYGFNGWGTYGQPIEVIAWRYIEPLEVK